MKKLISLLLCMALAVSLIPGVFAAEGDSYLALGDSITAGSALNEGEPSFPEILAENNGWVLTNMGADGQTAESLLAQITGGSLDAAISAAKVITITAGGNDAMHLMYELVAAAYNASNDPDITAEDVVTIMQNSSDSRWFNLMIAAAGVLSGNESTGTPPFAEREEVLTKIAESVADLKDAMAYIRKLNPSVTVIIPTQYNPYKDFTGLFQLVGDSVNKGCMKLNETIKANAEAAGYLVADVYTTFQNSTEKLCNATASPMNLDFHPNARGHEVIAELMQEIIDTIPEPDNNPFTDVPQGSFYYDPVLWAVENGITTGATATTFNPTGECQRAQVVTFLWRAAGKPEPSNTVNPFVDVKAEDFYYKAVLWAVENGITTGTDATHFSPFGICNRAQVVTFLHRAAGSPAVESANNPFTDVADGTWYTAPVLWAVANNITNGMTATEFGPNTACNRAQVVTFLFRADK